MAFFSAFEPTIGGDRFRIASSNMAYHNQPQSVTIKFTL